MNPFRTGVVLLLLSVMVAAWPTAESAWAGPGKPGADTSAVPAELRELMTDLDWGGWYQTETGYVPSTYFGAYAIQPLGPALYLGLGTGRPADVSGALLARYEAGAVTALYEPTEQGFLELVPHGGQIYVPGPDPCCPDGWDYGNTYAHDPVAGTTVKNRTMPDVFHTWGLWPGSGPTELFAAVSAHNGDTSDSFGQVLYSADGGASWSVRADYLDGLGYYRTYDIHGLGDQLYAVWNDFYGDPCGLAVGAADARTWQRLDGAYVTCRTRLLDYDGKLVALRDDRAALVTVDRRGRLGTYEFGDFRVTEWAYNYGANAADRNLVVVAEDGRVMASSNLRKWRELAHIGGPLITAAYWPEAESVVVARRGADAALWQVPVGKR